MRELNQLELLAITLKNRITPTGHQFLSRFTAVSLLTISKNYVKRARDV